MPIKEAGMPLRALALILLPATLVGESAPALIAPNQMTLVAPPANSVCAIPLLRVPVNASVDPGIVRTLPPVESRMPVFHPRVCGEETARSVMVLSPKENRLAPPPEARPGPEQK